MNREERMRELRPHNQEAIQGIGDSSISLVERLDHEIGHLTSRLHKLQALRELMAKEPGLQVMEKYLSLKQELGL